MYESAVFGSFAICFKMYGFAGVANNGKQPCLPLASTVTTIGRELIEKTRAFCEERVPGLRVIR